MLTQPRSRTEETIYVVATVTIRFISAHGSCILLLPNLLCLIRQCV